MTSWQEPPADWDDAYANAPYIPGGADYPARWAAKAAEFRAAHPPEVVAYGTHERERIDLFRPAGETTGLVVFIHGGYWKAFDRGDWSHLAAGPLARGWAVAMPGYVLAPEARIGGIVRALAGAIGRAAGLVGGPLRLAGHSAGGHVATRLVCADGLMGAAAAARVERVVSIGGLHDLRPLLRTAIGREIGLDAEEARAESPALLEPRDGLRVHAWVGAEERPVFRRQSALLVDAWAGLGAATAMTEEAGRHHFDVIDGLEDPDSALARAVCDDAAGRPFSPA